jgi:predicted nucleotidyltransferase
MLAKGAAAWPHFFQLKKRGGGNEEEPCLGEEIRRRTAMNKRRAAPKSAKQLNGIDIAPKKGIIAPVMGAMRKTPSLGTLLFGKTRRAVLALAFGRPEEAFYVRQVARYAATGNGVVQRELEQLAAVGILTRRPSGRQVYYQANPDCPIFKELKTLVVKTAGVVDILREALLPLAGSIQCAFIYGSFAAERQGARSDVDVMVIGDAPFKKVVGALATAQESLGREVNPTVYPLKEFRAKAASGHAFVATVIRGPKIFLTGDAHELEGLVKKRVACRARAKS